MTKKLLCLITMLSIIMIVIGCSEKSKEVKTPQYFTLKMEDMNIGGIYLQQPISETFAKLGNPIESMPGLPRGVSYLFSKNSPEIWISATDSDASGKVRFIGIIGKSSFATKSGIKYGSSINEIKKIYGTPERDFYYQKDHPAYKKGIKHVVWYEKEIEKTKAGHYHRLHFVFGLDESDKVFGMQCWEEWD